MSQATATAATAVADSEARALRQALGQYATGVAVVTARCAGTAYAMTINSFSAVSLDPPLVSWAIRRASARLSHFVGAEHFAVNVLAADQVAISKQFAKGDVEAFDPAQWREGQGGAPVLRGALAQFECVRECVYEGGDHEIIIGRVVSHQVHEGNPLVFSQGRYALTQEFAYPATTTATCAASVPAWDASVPLMPLLRQAHQHLSDAMEVHRRELDLTVISARVLTLLEAAATSAPSLERQVGTGNLALEDALVELGRHGLIEPTQGLYAITEAGRRRRATYTERARALYATCLADYSNEEKALFTKMLKHLCDVNIAVQPTSQT